MSKKLFLFFQFILPQRFLTELLCHLATLQRPQWLKNAFIRIFIRYYQIDMSRVAEPDIRKYSSFNEFFTRSLKPGLLPTTPCKQLMSPVEGTISQYGVITEGQLIQAKGIAYTVEDLLAKQTTWLPVFSKGLFITLYLSPRDYHCVHMPLPGKLIKTVYVPGQLFSVNKTSVEQISNLFARNERLLCEFDTPEGPFMLIFVGALLVAGIATAWGGKIARGTQIVESDYRHENLFFQQGEKIGHFQFGSTVILLLPIEGLAWNENCFVEQKVDLGMPLTF